MRQQLIAYGRDEGGASAAEFALVVTPFLALVFAIIGLSLLVYANSTLQFATENSARWASVTAAANGADPGSTAVLAHFSDVYKGPAISPAAVYNAAAACGHQVTATATFPLNAVVVDLSVPLSAQACFP
jgi:Flp pilus assembly protein TadG